MQVSRTAVRDLLLGLGVESASGWDATKFTAKLAQDGGISRYIDPGQVIPDPAQNKLYTDIVAAQSAGTAIVVIDDAAPPAKAGMAESGDKPAATKPKTTKPKTTKPKPAKTKPAGKKPAKKAEPVLAKTSPTAVALAKRVAVKRGSAKAKPAATTKTKPTKTKPAAAATETKRRGGRKPAELPKGVESGTYAARMYLWKKRYGETGHAELSSRAVTANTIVTELKTAGKGKNPKGVTKAFILDVLAAKFPDKSRESLAKYLNNMIPSRLSWKFGIHVWKNRPTEPGVSTTYYINGDGKTPQPEPKAK